jgi:hypothetical protein
MRLDSMEGGPWTELSWATEAENFFKVPPSILQDARAYDLEITLSAGRGYVAVVKGAEQKLLTPVGLWSLAPTSTRVQLSGNGRQYAYEHTAPLPQSLSVSHSLKLPAVVKLHAARNEKAMKSARRI